MPCLSFSLRKNKQAGFTLVELVVVIILLGIVAVASTQFIRQGVSIYTDSIGRDTLQQQGRFAIERMSRELRNALPGSVRTSGDGSCVEFAPIEAASSYLAPLADASDTSFEAVNFDYTDSTVSNRRVAVYPIDAVSVYVPTISSPAAVVNLTNVDLPASSIRDVNLSATHQFVNESPTRRFFIVIQPVSFCVRNNQLFRHESYGWLATQSTSTANIGNGVLLAENIQINDGGPVTVFDFTAGTPQRSGVVSMDLRFSHTASTGDEWARFSHEVFVRNTP